MISRFVVRRFRLLWISALVSAGWANRADLRRWAGFVRRAIDQRGTRSVADVVTEARVRFAVSSDPLLRRDPALDDLTVDDGAITLLTNTNAWPDMRNRVARLERVKGISSVTSTNGPRRAARFDSDRRRV